MNALIGRETKEFAVIQPVLVAEWEEFGHDQQREWVTDHLVNVCHNRPEVAAVLENTIQWASVPVRSLYPMFEGKFEDPDDWVVVRATVQAYPA